jgi:hypothetical protein
LPTTKNTTPIERIILPNSRKKIDKANPESKVYPKNDERIKTYKSLNESLSKVNSIKLNIRTTTRRKKIA